MWAAVTVVFVLSRASGDPVAQLLPEDADPAQVAQMQAALGLDRPLIVQYLDFLGGLVRLDLGDSLLYHEPVTSLLLERVPATVLLAFSALLITVVVAFLAGSIAAMRRGTGVDRAVMGAVLVGQSTPAFWVGILLVLLFGVQLRILPAAGYGTLAHLVLPATTLAIFSVAVVARLLRSSLIEVMGQDHVRTARAKGAGEIRVLLGHSLRNASVPGDHGARPRVRGPAGRRDPHGADLQLARPRPAHDRCHQLPRLPSGPGHRGALRRDVHRGEPAGGPQLRGHRPPSEDRRMNTTALPDASPGVSPSQSAPPSSGASRRHVDIPFLASSAFLALVVVLALIGPLLVGDPGAQNLLQRLSPPGTSGHLLGTDQLGRDVLARLVVGSRISVLVGVTAALLSGVIGSAIGILAGYTGGWTDRLLMRLTDVQLAFPTLLLALAVIGFVGPGLTTVIVVLGITGWVSYARVLRSEVLSLRTREFVEAAQVMGVPAHRIMLRHMLPNVTGPLADDPHAPGGHGHPRRSRPELPRPRHSSHDPHLGLDARRRPAVHGHRLVARGAPGHRAAADRAVDQHRR